MPARQVVFDLDETLIHCPRGGLDIRMAQERGLDVFTLGDGTPIILRPGFYSLLRFIRTYFDRIYVFTAASDLYAKEVSDIIFAGRAPAEVWSKSSCRFIADDRVLKPLSEKAGPDGEPVDTPDTIMVDDRPEVTGDNLWVRGENHFVVSRFVGSPDDRDLEDLTRRIMRWITGPRVASAPEPRATIGAIGRVPQGPVAGEIGARLDGDRPVAVRV